MSRPHYGCEYRGSGSSRGCRATPSPTCPCLPGSSAGRGGWAAAGMGGTAGSGLRECPAGAARPAGSPHEPRPAAPPARWAPCRAGARRSSTVLLRAGHKCWEKAVAGQRPGAPRLCRRRLPRAGPAPRPRCLPGRGGPAFRLPADFGDHTRLAGRNAAPVGPFTACHWLVVEGLASDLGGRRAGSPVLRYRVKNDQRRRRTWCCGGRCCKRQSVRPGL